MLGQELQWVAIYTKARNEKKVAENFVEQGIEHYLPLRRKLSQWSDRKKWVEVPLIASYVFVKTNLKGLYGVCRTPGVVTSVKFGGMTDRDTAIIPAQQIEDMRRLVASEQEIWVRNTNELQIGKSVRVLSGCCEGMVGNIVKANKDGNFAINIEGLGMSLVISVEKDMLMVVQEDERVKTKRRDYLKTL